MASGMNVLETEPADTTANWRLVVSEFGRLLGMAFVLSLALGLLLTAAAVVMPAPLSCQEGASRCELPPSGDGGSFFVRRAPGEPWASAPSLDLEVSISVVGLIARATVVQRFRNAADEPVEGRFVFPLPAHAAVERMQLRAGERVIPGLCLERGPARARFERPAGEAQPAALVELHRPNVVTASVANVGPGDEIAVAIDLAQTLDFDAGEVRLRFPLAVSPRSLEGSRLHAEIAALGLAPPASTPDRGIMRARRVSIVVEVAAGFPIQSVWSRSHPVVVEQVDETRCRVLLRELSVPADRDYELVWRPRAGTLPAGVVFLEEVGRWSYALVAAFPQLAAPEPGRGPREVVFLIDTSTSMEGAPLRLAKSALAHALDRLPPEDRFNVIQFNSLREPLFDLPRPATPRNRARARRFVESLQTNAGKDVGAALEAALVHTGNDVLREVVLLTDGEGVRDETGLASFRGSSAKVRLSAIGVGPSPNAPFLGRAAELGAGVLAYLVDTLEIEGEMRRFMAALEQEVLNDVEVSAAAPETDEWWPQRIVALRAGRPVVLAARFDGSRAPRDQVLTISGRRPSGSWRLRVPLASALPGKGLPATWARQKAHGLVDAALDGADALDMSAQLLTLGLEAKLLTAQTGILAGGGGSAAVRLAVEPGVRGLSPPPARGASRPAMAVLLALPILLALSHAVRRARQGRRLS